MTNELPEDMTYPDDFEGYGYTAEPLAEEVMDRLTDELTNLIIDEVEDTMHLWGDNPKRVYELVAQKLKGIADRRP